MTGLPFVHRAPNELELERLRLLLSTYQDGSGMLPPKGKRTTSLPGFRDFERATAAVFGGVAVESKFFVDVIFALTQAPDTFYGVDCKMRGELRKAENAGLITVEVTNASAEIWSSLVNTGITQATLIDNATLAGPAVIEAIEFMKKRGSSSYVHGPIVADSSYYLVLLWDNTSGYYRLYQLPIALPLSEGIDWACEIRRANTTESATRTLIGRYKGNVLYEWYGFSGGQFKYYPQTRDALWTSDRFQLEPLNDRNDVGLVAKAKAYFPEKWK